MSSCNLSDSLSAVAYHYVESIYEPAVKTFAQAVLECSAINSDEFWFTDEELSVCRAYVAQTSEVTDEAW